MTKSIGIVGYGFVGKACAMGFLQVGGFDVYVYDPFVTVGEVILYNEHKKENSTLHPVKSINELVHSNVDVIFVCVPTPMYEDGQSDTSIVESVCKGINFQAEILDLNKQVVVIKSTVPPGTTAKIDEKCENLHIAFNPEFLREATFLQDFLEQDRIVYGASSDEARRRLNWLYKAFIQNRAEKYGVDISNDKHPFHWRQTYIKEYEDPTAAEMVKYVANCYMATKISFANEMYQICEKLGISYDDVILAATKDKRLGPQYGWQVPGPVLVDGSPAFGYGLSCFPKDLNALIYHAEKNLGVDPKVMKAAWEKNLEVRPSAHRDWEKMKKAFKKKEK